jgi:3-dehydro-L-gulonate 2-dehydrogenase
MFRVPYGELFDVLSRSLLKLGFEKERALRSAQLFAESSRDGVQSHGLNRFPLFVSMIQSGAIDIHATPVLLAGSGPLERWDGKLGPGNLNAWHCMERAIVRSREHGMGCVALANTNHWMRGGSYGWQAADAGVIGVCWTNTLPNLPPWGASIPVLGNNPLVIAVPRPEGHVVLDMAMSQFSYGALASYRSRGELLPVEGGFDAEGRLTRVPAEIERSQRPLPIGYWKGSGLALMLDLLAGILSGGRTSHQIGPTPEREIGISQVFIAFDPASFGSSTSESGAIASQIADQVIGDLQSKTASAGESVRYPGQQVLRVRQENLEKGVPVDPSIWRQVQEILASQPGRPIEAS